MSFNWDDTSMFLLIQKFHENDILWNPKNADYKNRNKRTDTLNAIATIFGVNTSEIERKLKNLTSHYFRERKKFEQSRRWASDEVREPKWFAYKALNFLRDRREKKIPPETGENISMILETTSQDAPVLNADDISPEAEDIHFNVYSIPQPSTDAGSSNRYQKSSKRNLARDTNLYLAQKRKLTLELLSHDIYIRKLQALKLETELGIGRSEYTHELDAMKGIKTENTCDMEFEY